MSKARSVVLGSIVVAAILAYLVYQSPIGMILLLELRGSWGSPEKAAELYERHRNEFQEIVDTLNAHPALAPIYPNYDPDNERDRQIIPELRKLSLEDRKVYHGLVAKMQSVGIEVIGQAGEGFDPTTNMLVTFVIFSSGILDNATSINIIYHDGQKPLAQIRDFSYTCNPLDAPNWYVCEPKPGRDH
ncbi:MAG: hypothetical protein U1E67_09385 [Hyphomicrobiales bacterium]